MTTKEEPSGYIDEEHWWASNPIPDDFPDTVETFADVLRSLGTDKLNEETDPRFEDFAISSANDIIAEKGREWYWRHRGLLKYQLEYLAVF